MCFVQIAVVFLCIVLGACSIHPLPDDVTRDSTLTIVQKIRCETHDALRKVFARELLKSPYPQTREVAEQLDSGDLTIDAIDGRMLDRETLEFWEQYRATAVGYVFEFLITENNGNTGAATFRLPYSQGIITVGLEAGKDLRRQNKRKFEIVETIDELRASQPCAKSEVASERFDYPITGSIGMDEVVATFYALSREGVKLKSFADQLTFTTKLVGSVAPKIVLAPVADSFRLADASMRVVADRTDTHQLLFTLSLPPKFEARAVAGEKAKRRVVNELNRLRSLDHQERILDALDGRRMP